MKAFERLLKYVAVDTPSDPNSGLVPSSACQFDLAKILVEELKALGVENAHVDEKCYVYASIPATPGFENAKSLGFIAHMDTAPDFNGCHVKPQIHKDYDGRDVQFGETGRILKVKDFPHLAELKGRTLITTDGTSLLGCDDKGGIAEIMTMAERILSENIPHGKICIGFTPDEEIGEGADHFDVPGFGAEFAYTVDGGDIGEIEYENFNAASADFSIKGVSVHPGEAKDIMVNAGLIACEIAGKLPEQETPAHTEGREGFFHLTDISGDVVSAKLSYIIRDHDKNLFETKLNRLRALEVEMNQKYGANTVELTITHSYENMLSVIENNMHVVDLAKDAIFSVGLDPVSLPVRGGTDGARLSFMGLPCPNLGTGGYGFHGPFEHVSIDAMERVVKIVKEIVLNPIDK